MFPPPPESQLLLMSSTPLAGPFSSFKPLAHLSPPPRGIPSGPVEKLPCQSPSPKALFPTLPTLHHSSRFAACLSVCLLSYNINAVPAGAFVPLLPHHIPAPRTALTASFTFAECRHCCHVWIILNPSPDPALWFRDSQHQRFRPSGLGNSLWGRTGVGMVLCAVGRFTAALASTH